MDAIKTQECLLCPKKIPVPKMAEHINDCYTALKMRVERRGTEHVGCPICCGAFPANRLLAHIDKCANYLLKLQIQEQPHLKDLHNKLQQKHDTTTSPTLQQSTKQTSQKPTTPTQTLKPVPVTIYKTNKDPITIYPLETEPQQQKTDEQDNANATNTTMTNPSEKTTTDNKKSTGAIPKTIQVPPTPAPRTTKPKIEAPTVQTRTNRLTNLTKDMDRLYIDEETAFYNWFQLQNMTKRKEIERKIGSMNWETMTAKYNLERLKKLEEEKQEKKREILRKINEKRNKEMAKKRMEEDQQQRMGKHYSLALGLPQEMKALDSIYEEHEDGQPK